MQSWMEIIGQVFGFFAPTDSLNKKFSVGLNTGEVLQNFNTCDPYLRFKGIVSRDVEVCLLVSFDISHVTTPSGAFLFALKTSFSYQIFRFLCLSIASLLCKLIWAIRLSATIVVAPYCDMVARYLEFTVIRNFFLA
jgi:hypothetical protein